MAMPVSNYTNIPIIMKKVKPLGKVRSVLDIGCGFGKYGMLFREYLDIRLKRYVKEDWLTRIDAVEIFPEYITPMHNYIYNNVYTDNIISLQHILPSYDIILAIEIIEHIKRVYVPELLSTLSRISMKALFITTPAVRLAIGENPGWSNENETHVSFWTFNGLKVILPALQRLNNSVYFLDKQNG